MKLLSFGSHNFLGYLDLAIDMARVDPFTLICGYNYDFASASANGAGKSGISEHLAVGWFGRTLRGLETHHGKDSIVHEGTKGGCAVWVEAELPQGTLRVERYRRHPEFENQVRAWINGKDVRGRDARETDAKIEQLLGFNYDLFCRTVVIHSRLTESVNTMENRAIKAITERLLGLRDFDGLRTFTRERAVACESTAQRLQDKDAQLASRIEELNRQLEGLLAKQQEHKEQAQAALKSGADKVRELMNEHAKAVNAESLANAALKSAEKRRADLKERWAGLAPAQTKAATAEAELRAELKQILARQKRYSQLGDRCPECDQRITPQHVKAKMKELTGQANQLNQRADNAAKTLRMRDLEAGELETELQEAEAQANTARKAAAKAEQAVELLAERLNNERAQLDKAAADPYVELIAQARATLAKQITERAKAEGQLKDAQEQLRYLQFWQHGFGPDGLRSFMLDGATPVLNRLANVYLDALTDNTMAVTLNTVKQAKDGTFKDKFDIDVINESGAGVLGGSSDGELACLDLSINIAMSDMLESRIEGGIGLLFLDQAADLVDVPRATKLITLLRQKLDLAWCAEIGVRPKQNIFVISHKSEVADIIGSRLVVEKRNGVCSLQHKMVLNGVKDV